MDSLIFLGDQEKVLSEHLFPGDGLEALAVCLATQINHAFGRKFIVTSVHPIPYEVCERRSDLLTWPTEAIADLLDRATKEGKTVVKIHSHPLGPRVFSFQDDRSDRGLFPPIYNWCEGEAKHLSVVFSPGFIFGRVVNKDSSFSTLDKIWVVGEKLKLFTCEQAEKTAGAFDESTYQVNHKIIVGTVGASGTGGWLVEQCGRNEVGALVAVEPEILESKNLNRIVNATMADVGQPKVEIARWAVEAMGLGTKVLTRQTLVQARKTLEMLMACDVIFGCVDSVLGRYVLNLFCTYFGIPYFDVGVHIAVGDNALKDAVGGFEYLIPGKSSLLTREIFNSKELADETYRAYSPSHYDRLKHDGYVRGKAVPRPAVGTINCLAVTKAFEEFQAQVLGYRSHENCAASWVFSVKSNEVIKSDESQFAEDLSLKPKVGQGLKFFEKERHLILEEEQATEVASAGE